MPGKLTTRMIESAGVPSAGKAFLWGGEAGRAVSLETAVHPCAVGRITMLPTSTSGGCSMA